MFQVKIKNISTENFKDFGKVVSFPEKQPTSEAVHYQFWSDIASYSIEGQTEIGLCKVLKQKRNIINSMERHLNTPEILIPIDAPFVLPVMRKSDSGKSAEAFKVDIGQAVIINSAIWHGACIPVNQNESSYFVIFRRGTPAEDVQLSDTQEIEIVD